MSPRTESPQTTAWPEDLGPEARSLPVAAIVPSPAARKALVKLGIATLGDLVRVPRAELLAVKGFGAKSLAALDRTLAALQRTPRPEPAAAPEVAGTAWLDLIPVAVLAFPTESLGLPVALRHRFRTEGLHDVEALLRAATRLRSDPEIGPEGLAAIRTAIDRLVAPALRTTVHALESDALPALVEQSLSALPDEERLLLSRRLGVGMAPLPLRALALREKLTIPALRERLAEIRERLHARAAGCLSRLFDAAQTELAAREGCLSAEHVPPGTLLHAPRSSGLRPDLGLRLVAFCYPKQMHLDGEALTTVPRRRLERIARLARRLGPPPGGSHSLAALETALGRTARGIPRAVFARALARAGLTIAIDREQGEIVTCERRTRGDRLRRILVDFGRPLQLDDLLFHYRDRHHKGHQGRILDALRSDRRFLEIGPSVYALREWHLDELELVREEAQDLVQKIVQAGARRELRELDPGLSERTYWLLRDCLDRDPQVRPLGRGAYCPRGLRHSAVLGVMLRDLKRAMGELPRARFLQNQPPERRRLVAHLLRVNRLFVEPAVDRIDLLTNYPFQEQRLARLVQQVRDRLEANRGYATSSDLCAHLAANDIGGEFLSVGLLEDLLRRHAPFELLPGGIVAEPALGLQRWIRQRVRDVLRATQLGMTVGEILAEAPELAEFEPCLRRLLEEDPTIASPDLLRFQIA